MNNLFNPDQHRGNVLGYPGRHSYDEGSARPEPTLSEYISVVVQNWRSIFVVAAAIFALGLTYAFVATPVYRADAMIQVEDSASSSKDPLGELASLFNTTATAAAEIELVKSRLVIQKTVEQQHLDISAAPAYFPVVGKVISRYAKSGTLAAPLFGLNRFAWGGEHIDLSRFDLPYDTSYTLIAGRAHSFELRNKDDDVVAHGVVGQPCIAVIDGAQATILVDRLVANAGTQFTVKRSRLLDTISSLQDAIVVEEKTKQSGVIGVTLDGDDSDKVTRIVNGIGANYVEQNVMRKRDEAQATLNFLAKQLPALKSKLESSESAYNAFRNRKGTVDLSEESKLLLGQLVDLKSKQMDLEQKRNELQQRFSDDHPAVVALTSNIASIAAEQKSLAGRVENLPNTEQEALRLLRDVRVNTALYTNLLDSSQQLSVVEAGQVGNVRVVDWAMHPDRPVKPKKMIVAGLSLIIGIVLGVAIPFVRRSLQVRIEHSDQIEQILGAPVYSVIPHSSRQGIIERQLRKGRTGQLLLAGTAQDDIAIEAIRSLQTALYFGAFDAVNNIILITGSRPDVGKSFLAANLAAVLAAGGKRILLIDADMRRGNTHTYFGIGVVPGLSESLSKEGAEALIHRDVLPGLDFLSRGSIMPNPAELLMNGRLKLLLDEFSSKYDAVIIDTPPVLAVTDATVIARHAATTLLAVRHGQQTSNEIAETARRMRNADVVVRGVVLTDVPQSRLGYGSYNAGYYAYESR
ncbi:polysaccharide biosynthesis tyrosine autokinase [Paraburkholderia sp. BCC1886]|uniref:polysaccharide biosynthesis tyrosine autokinase n=1 Tax=Paraburkholderia sp. BCC1886 TaxID=2562670 RepID=UPI0011842A35|nr:polysaccharide biosynthesis tyrosine autokinase [Paraburkholderia sp. BCC1886]